MTSKEKEIIAYHEAGHVIMNYYLGWKVLYFGKAEDENGYNTKSDKSDDVNYKWVKNLVDFNSLTQAQLKIVIAKHEDRILLAMGGEVAQCKFEGKNLRYIYQFPDYSRPEEKSDISVIKIIKETLKEKLQYNVHCTNLMTNCKKIINDNWEVVIALAKELINSPSFHVKNEKIEEILLKGKFQPRN